MYISCEHPLCSFHINSDLDLLNTLILLPGGRGQDFEYRWREGAWREDRTL